MSRRVETHDDVYHPPMVYLGPDDHTLPFEIRYTSLGVWVVLTAAWWALDRFVLMGVLGWSVFVIGPVSAALLMGVVDHERPLVAHVESFAREVARVALRRRPGPQTVVILMRITAQHVVGPVKKVRAPRLRQYIARRPRPLRALAKVMLPDD